MGMEDSIKELELHSYGVTGVAQQADQYTHTTKAIAEYVGRIFGHEMKLLVSAGTELVPTKPVFPADAATNEEAKAVGEKSTTST